MSWENSNAITPLKRDFLKSFFAREKRFFLTGGSALGLFYLDHRYSYDVDLFSEERPDWLDVDGGLDPGMVSLLLDSLTVTELPDYLIRPLTLAQLCSFIDDLKRRMALMAYPDRPKA
jgi:hypothetical protein